jgi:hypothetical protein
MLQLQKQLRTRAPPAGKVPSPPETGSCLVCGTKMSAGSGICDKCNSKRRWEISRLTTPLYTLAIIALCICFLILVNSDEMLSSFQIDLSNRQDIGYLFLILSVLTGMVFSWQRRKALSMGEVYRSLLPILSIVMIPVPIVLLSLELTSIVTILSAVVIFPIAGIILILFRKEARDMGLSGFLFLAVGSILTLFGLMFSIKDIELTGFIWFLSGKHVVVLGVISLFIGGFATISKFSVVSKSAGVPIFYILAAVSFIILVFLSRGTTGGESIKDLLLVVPFILLVISTSSFLTETVNDLRIENINTSMKEALKRSEDLEKEKKIFYSLQQMDRAISSNPIDGFGRTAEHPSVIFTMEGPGLLEDFTFVPSEYEISLNEKGKILSSQGKFPEAAKEYQEAIKRSPEYLASYQNLAMLLSSIPGKKKEGVKHIDYILGSKEVYLKRWMRYGVPTRYVYWMADSMMLYRDMLHKKSDLLYRLSREGDVWAYYSLVRY